MRRLFPLAALLCISASTLAAQNLPLPASPAGADPLSTPSGTLTNPLEQPTLSPGVILLMELDGRFEKSVEAGGGKAFASWFANDAVILSNGKPAVMGHTAIAAQSQWDPKVYQLIWVPEGAQMGPSNEMGFTWGHYEGRSKDKNGQPVVVSGRYLTVWKKLPNGDWKVALDASADAPPTAGECCTLPKP